MRLLPLCDHMDKFDLVSSLWVDYLLEQQPEGNREAFLILVQNKLKTEPENECVLFEFDDTIVGFAIACIKEECFPDEDLPEISLQVAVFYIAPAFRQQHFGHAAFTRLCEWGRGRKASIIDVVADTEEGGWFLSGLGLELIGKGVHTVYRRFI